MNTELNELENFLNTHEIPKPKKYRKTFLGIAKQPHYENVLSNIYAFYFDQNEEHGLENLFTKSLVEIISDKTKTKVQFSENFFDLSNFKNFDTSTEVSTVKGGRIDLLLDNGEYAILIENKVYHQLNNNLCDYWNSVAYLDNYKVGIVLSLKPTFSGHQFFINIAHKELLDHVMTHLGSYIMKATDKYITFLKDLFQNITNLTNATMKQEDVAFYFKNQSKINQAARFKGDVKKHIKSEVEKAGELNGHFILNIPKTNSNLENRARYYDSKLHFNLTIVVIFEHLLTKEKKLSIIIELRHDFTKKDTKMLFEKCGNNFKGDDVIDPQFYTDQTGWLHFYTREYTVQNIGTTPLSEFIEDKLKNDNFIDIFKSMEDVIRKEMPERVNKD